ncbi:MAG TPA: Gfo/Idh/MocA family oxidoreductase [Bacteroidales bacterium]|nr:Gfo/Idh/MocA family oxidoreductase [Bacteroidales bacterium]
MIKTGIIGLGKMGLSHASIINAHPDLDLVAVCDASALILEALRKYGNFKTYSDYNQMLAENDLEALFVATPTKFHAEMVLKALAKKVNVFCEKPFSLTVGDGLKMVELASSNNLVNQVGYHNRFIGTFNFVRKLIQSKILGDLYHFVGEAYGPVVIKKKEATWRSESSEGGGCLFDYASHVINLVQFILGDIHDVNGVMLKKIFSKGVEDAVYSGVSLESGLTGLLSVNWSDETYRKMSTQITVMGTEGKIIADAQEVKIYLRSDNPQFGFEKGWNMRYITDLTENVDFYLRGEEYSAQIDYFARQVKAKSVENVNSFSSALKTDIVIDLIKSKAS